MVKSGIVESLGYNEGKCYIHLGPERGSHIPAPRPKLYTVNPKP